MGDNVDPGGDRSNLVDKRDTLVAKSDVVVNEGNEGEALLEESNDQETKARLGVYKKTLLRWLRWRLEGVEGAGAVTDLSFDLRDGVLLLKLLAKLTDTQIPVEKGEFRVQRLGNLSCVVEVMQRERARTEGLNINLILEGHLDNTLNLIWNILVRWELQPRFSRKDWEPFSIDQILLSWLNTLNPQPPVLNLQQDLQDGLVLSRLVLSSHPNLPGLQDSLQQTGEERWSTLLRCALRSLDTPALLDAEDLAQGVVDKNSLLCFLGILFSSLPQDHVTSDLIHTLNIAPDPTLGAKISGSPVKSQARKADEELSLEGWTNCLEEVLSWILEAEEHLLSLHNLGHRQLHTVKAKFYNHEDFMLELQNHQGAVGKVLSRGRELVTKLPRAQDQVEVRLQMKVLIDRWEKVRELAMSKQSELHQLIMRLQLEQISSLRSWITAAEDRISRLGLTGETKEQVWEEVSEVERLQGDLEDQHAAVTAISNFILVESDEATNIEDELTGLGERWCMICRCIEERLHLLQTVQGVLLEQERLNSYLQGVETMLKEMEMSQEVDSVHLQEQTNRIMAVEEELEVERGKLTQLGVDTENVQVRSLENDPGVTKLSNKMETLQDRWDVLIEILFAQKHRISKLSSDLNHSKDETKSATKRRKLTASRRTHFHTSYSRILSWSETIISRLEESLLRSLPLQDQTLLLEETQAEVDAQQGTIKIGRAHV